MGFPTTVSMRSGNGSGVPCRHAHKVARAGRRTSDIHDSLQGSRGPRARQGVCRAEGGSPSASRAQRPQKQSGTKPNTLAATRRTRSGAL